ncbi:MAG: sensor histidine kinase [Chloroflexales bacterium]|nr:sensor histidine kinase [Chloroflexales bacterium]
MIKSINKDLVRRLSIPTMQSNISQSTDSLESRLLTIFRVLAMMRLVITCVLMILSSMVLTGVALGHIATLIELNLLLIYLHVPYLRRRLGASYLPIALLWASIVPLLIQNVSLYRFFNVPERPVLTILRTPMIENAGVLGSLGQTLTILIIPLIIVSWRYSRRTVLLFCAGTSLLDIMVITLFIPLSTVGLLLAINLVIFRSVLFVMIGLIVNQLVAVHLAQQRSLTAANEQLRQYAATREQLAISQERNRLARELHDTLAHTLAATSVQLEAVRVIWDHQPAKAQQMVTQAVHMLRDGLTETRQALQALRAESLDRLGFLATIEVLAESIAVRHNLPVAVQAPVRITGLDAETEHTLYRIVQEALFNCVQHARATQITITVEQCDDTATIRIIDDGVGFDVDAVTAPGHFGIRGMRERARAIDAKFQLSSHSGHGCAVTIQLQGKGHAYSDL